MWLGGWVFLVWFGIPGAARLYLRSEIGNPVDVHLITGELVLSIALQNG
jgi:TM2 domain-containing membrane protein YozV